MGVYGSMLRAGPSRQASIWISRGNIIKTRLFAAIGHPRPLKETDGKYFVCNGQTGQIYTLLAGKSVLKTLRGLATFPSLAPKSTLQLRNLGLT